MKCYASFVGNCSEKISREHVISKSLLLSNVGVSGFDWCKGEEVIIGSNSFTQKILCTTHNTLLSPFDNEMQKLFDTLDKFNRTKISRIIYNKEEMEVIKGEFIERWVLKTCINLIHYFSNSGKVSFEEKLVLPYLFGDKLFSYPFGLSICFPSTMQADFKGKLHFNVGSTLIGNERFLDTAFLIFKGLIFIFHLPTETNIMKENMLKAQCSGKIMTKNGFIQMWHFLGIDLENRPNKKIVINWND